MNKYDFLIGISRYLSHQGRPLKRRNKPATSNTRRVKTWNKRHSRPVDVIHSVGEK